MFITVGMPSSRRIGPTCRMAGCISGANMNTMPARSSAARHDADRRVDRHAELLEHVRAAALRGERAVAVLRDAHSGTRDEQRRGGRDVERVDRPAARAARVDQLVRTFGRHDDHRLPKRADHRRQLLRGLALHAQADEERRDLHRRRVAAQDHLERVGQLVRFRRFTGRQALDHVEHRARRGASAASRATRH